MGKKEYPPIEVHKNILVRLTGEPEAEGEPADAEFDRRENKIFLYTDYNNSVEDVIRGIIHEYIHYLQSGSWMKRYYSMGYTKRRRTNTKANTRNNTNRGYKRC